MRKQSGSLPAQRRERVLKLIEDSGSVAVPELARHFGVSLDTIRRDLDALALSGALIRAHGGAMRAREGDKLRPLEERFSQNPSSKRAIARAAASLVRDGETLIVNGGSTTLYVMEELTAHSSTVVITSSIAILDMPDIERFSSVHVLGGQYIPSTRVNVGPLSLPDVERINIDTAIIGVRALNDKSGISTGALAEASMIAGMMALARRTIVVADGTKLGCGAFATIAPLDKIDILVTDGTPSTELQKALDAASVRVIRA